MLATKVKSKVSHLPSNKSLISLAACIPSSLRFFSICFERARAARSSADIAQPIAPQICVIVVMVVVFVERRIDINQPININVPRESISMSLKIEY